MSDTNWTPGPWSTRQAEDTNWWWVIENASGVEIGSGDGGYDEEEACLIAAAPDLYEALGTMMALARTKWGNLDEDFNVCYAQARLAREKARGEHNG